MTYKPSLEEFIAKSKQGNLIPVYGEILADMETPVSAFKKIDGGKYSYLLESVAGGDKWARYCFLGANPSLVFKSKKNRVEIIKDGQTEAFWADNPLDKLKELMGKYQPVHVEGLPRFFGGAVGYIGYDMIHFFEELPDNTTDDLSLSDMLFIFTDSILIFDNLNLTIKVVCNVHLHADTDIIHAYRNAQNQINDIIGKLKQSLPDYSLINRASAGSDSNGGIESNMSREEFVDAVKKAKEYILAGDILQVVLSQRLSAQIEASGFDIYRILRSINPSPYMYYLKFDDLQIIGSSPEVLVRVEDDKVEVRPIAGTRPRGDTEVEDMRLEKELLADEKECAEHLMLVDLGRNDVGRIAKTGMVEVTEYMSVEHYSHVMHIVSNVRGILKDGKDVFEALAACFPAGTVSGAPKIRAMQIIDELEPTRRGPYAGAVGYFSFSGNMDTCITIRTILVKDGCAYVQAGAGIVADSVPECEYEETLNKAKALIKAIKLAGIK